MLNLPKFMQKLSGSLKYLVATLLVAIPLYPKFPFIDVPGTQVSIRLEDFLILITTAVWFLVSLPKYKKFLKDKIFIAIFLFLVIGLLSVFSGIFVTKTVVPHIGFLHWARRVEYIVCFFIGVQSVKDKANLSFFLKLLALVIFFAFIFGVGQKHFNWPIITTQNSEYSKGIALRYKPGAHLVSTFAGHYDLATFLVLVIPIFYALILSPKKIIAKETKAVFTVVLLMSLWLLVNTASRISIASYLGSSLLVFIFLKKYKYIPIMLVLSVIFISMSSNLLMRYTNLLNISLPKLVETLAPAINAQELHERVDSSQLEKKDEGVQVIEDRSTSIRLNVEWPRAVRAATKNPLLGTGYSSITLATDNGFLRALGETGFLGFVALLLVLWRVFAGLAMNLARYGAQSLDDIYIMSILAAFPGIMLNMVFIDILDASKFAIMFWLLAGIAIGSVRHND